MCACDPSQILLGAVDTGKGAAESRQRFVRGRQEAAPPFGRMAFPGKAAKVAGQGVYPRFFGARVRKRLKGREIGTERERVRR